jgi:ABC-type amino acid transport substrate-binding protein
MKRFLALALCAAMLSSAPVRAADKPMLEYGYPEQPPRVFTRGDGQPDGHYPRLLKVLLERAGLEWRANPLPAARLMKSLDSGETNFSILVKNPLLDACCLYGTQPIWYDELTVFSAGDTAPVTSKEDLIGKDLIVIAGYSYGGLISFLKDPANRINLNPAESHAAAFAMLDAGRAPYLLNYAEPAIAEGLMKHHVADLKKSPISRIDMYLVLRKAYPDAPAVIERLENLYRALYAEDSERRYTKK